MVIPSHTVSTGHTARTANGGSCLSARKPMRHRGPPRGDPSVMRTGTAGTAAQGAPQGPRPASYAPSGGLAWLGRFAVRHPRPILAAAGLFVIIAVVFGSSAAAHLSSGGFIDPGAQSTQAGQVLGQTFRSEDPSFVVLATGRHVNINSPAARKAGHALTVILNDDMGLAAVQSYWAIHNSYWAVGNHHNPVLHSRDGRQALILGYATGDAATQAATTQRIAKQLWSNSVLRVQVGGAAITNLEASNQIKHALVTAESIALLLTLLLLVLAFRGLIAAPDHRRHRHRRHAAPAARPSFGHQCLRLLAEPHHGP